ncbi:MAG: tetratricopeptide repeat protein, partial [Candidatus Fermentibacteria bacterium]|nr:tetratricopeptide repeat protein [Candidatus Fermentibacteria bacterium]
MILLLTLLSVWPLEWYQEYSQLNWGSMEEISSEYGDSAAELAVKAISQFGIGTGDPIATAMEAIALDSTDYRTWTALVFVGMEQDSLRMDSLFSRAFQLVAGVDPLLSEAYGYWLLSMGNSAEALVYSSGSLEADSSFAPAWLTHSMALVDQGRLDEALAVSQEAIWRLPDCVPLLLQYGEVLEESGHALRAIDAYREVIVLDPTRVSAYASLGPALEGIKRNGEALKVYREVLRIRPEYGWAWGRLASCLMNENQFDLADSCFSNSLEFSPDNSWVLYQLARLRKETDPVYAIELFQHSVQLDPDFSSAWQELAFLYESGNNFPEAEIALRRCVELDPEPWLYGELGWVLENMGMYTEAAEVYETSISIDSQYLYGWQRRGDLFKISGDSNSASDWYREALQVLDEDDPWIWRELGSMAVAESLYDSAGYCFQMALKTDPNYSPAWLDLARIQRKTGELEDTMLSLEEYLQLSGDSAVVSAEIILLQDLNGENTDSLTAVMLELWPDGWITAGWSASDNSFVHLALEFADIAFDSALETPWQLINLGELFGVLDRPEKQIICYDLASEMDTDDFRVAVRIADFYYDKGMTGMAIELLSESYNSYEWNETLTTALAEAYLFDDQLAEAELLLLQVVERNPFSV